MVTKGASFIWERRWKNNFYSATERQREREPCYTLRSFLNGWRLRKGKKKRRREGRAGGVKMRSKWAKKIGIKAVEGSDVLRIGYPTVLLRSSFQRRGKEHGLPRRIYPLPSSLSLSFLISLCVLTLSIPPLRVLNYTFGARSRASLKHPASSSSSLRLFSLFSFSLSLLFNFDRRSFLNEFAVRV